MVRRIAIPAVVAAGLAVAGWACGEKSREEKCRDAIREGIWERVAAACPVEELGEELLVEAGIFALSESQSREAIQYFSAVAPDAESYGSARYGTMLAELQRFLAGGFSPPSLFSPLFPGRRSAAESVRPGQLYLDIGYEFFPLDRIDDVRNLRLLAREAVAGGWSLRVDDLPLLVGGEGEDYSLAFNSGGIFGGLFARIVWLGSDIFLAFLDYLSAHSLVIDANSFFGISLDESDLIGILRRLAQVPADSPSFLQKSAGWDDRIGEIVDEIVGAGVENMKAIPAALAAASVADPGSCEGAICLVDLDWGGTVSGGDQILIGGTLEGEFDAEFFQSLGIGYDYDTANEITLMQETLAEIGIEVEASIERIELEVDFSSPGFLAATALFAATWADISGPLGDLLDRVAASAQSESSSVTLADLNPVFDVLGLPALPDAIALNIARFLDMPLGGLIASVCEEGVFEPADCDADTAYPVFLLEFELKDVARQCSEYGFCGFEPYQPYYREGDTGHFAGTEHEIQPDGVSPGTFVLESERTTDILVYFAVADPTLNGALSADLSGLPVACAPEGEAGFAPDATSYSLNKILNCLLATYYPRIEESELIGLILELADPFLLVR